jgi:hypothetical protein
MKYLGSAILWLALWLGAWAGVRAEPAPPVVPDVEPDVEPDGELSAVLHGPVPFDRAELQDALLPRLDDASIDTRAAARGTVVEVSATASGVRVRVGTRERTLSLGERTGPGAARVVALVVLDLLLSEGPALPMPLAPPPAAGSGEILGAAAEATPKATTDATPEAITDATGTHAATAPITTAPATTAPPTRPKSLSFEPPPPPPARPAAPTDVAPPRLAAPGVAAQPAPDSPARPASRLVSGPRTMPARTVTHVRLSGFGGTAVGRTSGEATMFSAGADVRLGLGSWRAGLGLSWLHLPTASYDQTHIGMNGAALRLDAGRAFGEVELTAGAFAMPSRLHTDASESPRAYHDSLLFGGGAAIRAGTRLGRSVRFVATGGLDVFGRRLRVRTPDEVITSTPVMAVSLTAGVSWEVMP